VTQDGRVLGLEQSMDFPEDGEGLHLYQEIAPVHPLVVSSLGPRQFYDLIVKNPTSLITLPAICFVELRLGELATDPERGDVRDLPYSNIGHLRECLKDLKVKTVHTKMVNRVEPASFSYRTIKSGIFVGNAHQLVYFAMPSQEDLRNEHYHWWRSANM
jgi:hypothetical protein